MNNTNVIKKFLIFFLLISLLLPCFVLPSAALTEPAEDATKSTHCAVYNVDEDVIMYSKGLSERIYPSSTVKMMTGILAYEYYKDKMDTMVTVTSDSLSYGSGGLSIHLEVDEVISAKDLLYALIIYNANDAGCVLAHNIAGSVPNFVHMMNEKASELGCTDTFFTNPTGMDDDEMHTTVADLLKIAAYCAKDSGYLKFTSTDYRDLDATNKNDVRRIWNRNFLVSTYMYTKYYDSMGKGIVSGSTEKGGYCAVELVTRYGVNYVAVVMDSKYDQEADYHYVYSDAEKILAWAYRNYDYATIADTKQMICELPVKQSQNGDHVALVPQKDVAIFVPNDADLDKDVSLSWRLFGDELQAPVNKGMVAGILTVKYQGKVLTTVKLITKSEMPKSVFLQFISILKKIVSNPFFILFLLFCLGVAGFGVYNTAKRRGRRINKLRRLQKRKTEQKQNPPSKQ